MNHRALLAMLVAIVAIASAAALAPQSDAEGTDALLIDEGNGVTAWSVPGTGTYAEAIASGAASAGYAVTIGDRISVDGVTERSTGHVTASWRLFIWDGAWTDSTGSIDLSSSYPGGSLAIGFYPEGMAPVETPDSKESWTMVRGDSGNSGSQTTALPTETGHVAWTHVYGDSDYVNETILVEGDHAYVVSGGGYTATMNSPALHCYDRTTGEELWRFEYEMGAGYETATGLIMSGYYYLPATNGHLYRIPLTGPGDGDSEVEVLDVPNTRDHDLTGNSYFTGPAALVADSGVIYFGTSIGYLWCVDADLDVLWTAPLSGSVYYSSPTVFGDYVAIGALDGVLYLFDRYDGTLLDSESVFTITTTVKNPLDGTVTERTYGGVNPPVLVGDTLMMSFSDGQGMNAMEGGIAGYRIIEGKLDQVFKESIGLVSNYITPVITDGFSGCYFMFSDSLTRVSTTGSVETVASDLGNFKAPVTLVNGGYLFFPEYDRGGRIYQTDLDGNVISMMRQPEEVAQYCMHPVVLVDGLIYMGTDGGSFGYIGAMPSVSDEPVSPSDDDDGGFPMAAIAVMILVLIAIAVMILVRRRESDRDAAPVPGSGSKVRRNKRRLAIVLAAGIVAVFAVLLLTLAWGPSGTYGLSETLFILGSAIGKAFDGGTLSYDEIIIFDSRCSRAVAAFAVGMGLSISGCMYQAIIRNPMVDPYIMGVSAGAGVAAVAVIAFDFTFFGLFEDVTYATPIVAMIGGLAAFACTMLLAEKAGGSSLNYVLAGVIVGLVFSAIQTLMLSMAGNKLNSAMSWLFGSFASISWTQTVLVFIPALAMSLVPLLWAKEFNLVLLGEDQARQMGLDVRMFNRCMLILASVLASVCVAFVGIIGFVGLVVPHLCRMVLGGDHRLVMPASIVVGGALMMAADLFAKMAWVPMELPVGAITTVIGAPVFAYLLIRKGRMYDG